MLKVTAPVGKGKKASADKSCKTAKGKGRKQL